MNRLALWGTLVSAALVIAGCSAVGASSSATSGVTEMQTAGSMSAGQLCEVDQLTYSLGAVVAHRGRYFRCTEIHLVELNSAKKVGWVELGADLNSFAELGKP